MQPGLGPARTSFLPSQLMNRGRVQTVPARRLSRSPPHPHLGGPVRGPQAEQGRGFPGAADRGDCRVCPAPGSPPPTCSSSLTDCPNAWNTLSVFFAHRGRPGDSGWPCDCLSVSESVGSRVVRWRGASGSRGPTQLSIWCPKAWPLPAQGPPLQAVETHLAGRQETLPRGSFVSR